MPQDAVLAVVVISYLTILVGLGVFMSKRVSVASEFLVAGRKLGLALTTATLAALQLGAGVVLAFAVPDTAASEPLTFDPDVCIGCNICVDICQVDILLPNPEAGGPPIVLYPGECWYDGSCVPACPEPGAISLNSMAEKRVHFRRKASGEDFFVE